MPPFRGTEAWDIYISDTHWQYVITKLGDLHFGIDAGYIDHNGRWVHFPRVHRESLTTSRRFLANFVNMARDNGHDVDYDKTLDQYATKEA